MDFRGGSILSVKFSRYSVNREPGSLTHCHFGWVNFPRKSWVSFNYKSTIVRGAVFESIVPEAKNMTDEEAAALLRFALTSEPVREYLKKRAENGNAE